MDGFIFRACFSGDAVFKYWCIFSPTKEMDRIARVFSRSKKPQAEHRTEYTNRSGKDRSGEYSALMAPPADTLTVSSPIEQAAGDVAIDAATFETLVVDDFTALPPAVAGELPVDQEDGGEPVPGGQTASPPAADPSQIEAVCAVPEDQTKLTPAPPTQAESALAVAVTGEMMQELLTISHRVVALNKTRFGIVFRRGDELKNGPLGINIVTYDMSMSSTDENVVPRFMCVTISAFPEMDRSIFAKSITHWLEITTYVNDFCTGNVRFLGDVRKAVNFTVRNYANSALFFIQTLRAILMKDEEYDYPGYIALWFKKFFDEIELIVTLKMEEYTNLRRNMETIVQMTTPLFEPQGNA